MFAVICSIYNINHTGCIVRYPWICKIALTLTTITFISFPSRNWYLSWNLSPLSYLQNCFIFFLRFLCHGLFFFDAPVSALFCISLSYSPFLSPSLSILSIILCFLGRGMRTLCLKYHWTVQHSVIGCLSAHMFTAVALRCVKTSNKPTHPQLKEEGRREKGTLAVKNELCALCSSPRSMVSQHLHEKRGPSTPPPPLLTLTSGPHSAWVLLRSEQFFV